MKLALRVAAWPLGVLFLFSAVSSLLIEGEWVLGCAALLIGFMLLLYTLHGSERLQVHPSHWRPPPLSPSRSAQAHSERGADAPITDRSRK